MCFTKFSVSQCMLYNILSLAVRVLLYSQSHSVCFTESEFHSVCLTTFAVSKYICFDKFSVSSICFTKFSVSPCIFLAQEHLRMTMVDPLCCTKLTLPVQIECGPAELEESVLLSHALQVCADHFEYLLGFFCFSRVGCDKVLPSCFLSL